MAVTDANGTWYSDGVAVEYAPDMPTIVVKADRAEAVKDEVVTYKVTVTNAAGAVEYAWQRSGNGGQSWVATSLPGYNTDTLSFPANESRLAYEYRVAVTDENGTWYSKGVKVDYIIIEPTVTVEANCAKAGPGMTVTYTATVENAAGAVEYAWQRSSNGGQNWMSTTLSGYNTDTLSFVANESRLAYEYRVAVTDANGTWYSDGVAVEYAPDMPTIVVKADRAEAVKIEVVTYKATVTNAAGAVEYAWQRSGNGGQSWVATSLPGYNTDTLSFPANEARLAYQYRVAVTDENGTWYSNGVKVELVVRPAVAVSANKASAVPGQMVTFTSAVKDTTGALKYQWQKSEDGNSWTSTALDGCNTDALSFAATEARLAYQYRLVVTDENGKWYSNAVKVNLLPVPVITVSANKTGVVSGQTVTYTSTIRNTTGTVKYQWQKSEDGSTWTSTALDGYNTATLSFAATAARLAYRYRLAVTDANGAWHSNSVKTMPLPKPVITATANKASAMVGETVAIAGTATNTNGALKYRWQRSEDGSTWTPTSLDGYDTDTLTFAATEARLAYRYRLEVTDANGTWHSNAVKVTIKYPPELHASANKTSAMAGDTVAITGTANNTSGTVKYQWRRSEDGSSWTSTSLDGYNTDTLSFIANETRLSYRYRLAVTDANGAWYSNSVKTTLLPKPVITVTASKTGVVDGQTVTYTSVAKNTSGTLKYQWQRSEDGTTWTSTALDGYNTATLSFAATQARLSYRYRLAVTDANGTWHSNSVTVTWKQKPVITAKASKTSIVDGQTITFTATTSNTSGTLKYQWQRSEDGSTWTSTVLDGYNTATLSFAATQARLSYRYRLAVTDANGTWHSNGVKVTWLPKPVITAKASAASVVDGKTITFTATTSNTSGTLKYQWQKSADGTTWTSTVLDVNHTATLSFTANEDRMAYQYTAWR